MKVISSFKLENNNITEPVEDLEQLLSQYKLQTEKIAKKFINNSAQTLGYQIDWKSN